ncbi:phosphatase PAP2 family protein [Pigmentiphaga aceris]|uniref:Phosphatase PAP2 family protein n=1 Tax=Pigmentiphaga aceris TaxID=1940612 RepID=A0A5C0B0F6_9BURK|nr:phosphatase PAP2 family protein [Pigmentiphaga aceris]QEI07183.1 phosphatase PAP2 family protein [Pigmentiphaga aceris]
MPSWTYVIIFGDAALAISLAGGIALVLMQQRAWSRLWLWIASFAVAFLAIVLGKASFDFTGWALPSIGMYSVSGHAMLTTAVYPVLFGLLACNRSSGVKRAAVLAGWAVAGVMAVVLVAGRYHTVSETVLGGAIGGCVAWLNLRRMQPMRLAIPWLPITIAGFCAVLVLPTGVARAAKTELWLRTGEWVGASERYVRFIERSPFEGGSHVRVILVPADVEF